MKNNNSTQENKESIISANGEAYTQATTTTQGKSKQFNTLLATIDEDGISQTIDLVSIGLVDYNPYND